MKAIVSVLGQDRKGIIAKVSMALYEMEVNIEDISQTIMQNEFFSMIMLVDLGKRPVEEINNRLQQLAQEMKVDIRVQHEDIFNSMHRI